MNIVVGNSRWAAVAYLGWLLTLTPAITLAARLPPVLIPWTGSPYTVGDGLEDIALGDFNNDGIADIAATSSNGHVSVLLGQEDATMSAAADSPFSSGVNFIRSISAADIDHDGNLDVVGVDTYSGDIIALMGDGSGRLTPADESPFAAGTSSWHSTVADFNGDGRPDIAIADPSFPAYNDIVALNSGDGKFAKAQQTVYPVGANPVDILAVDLNNDGYPDLVTTNYNAHTLTMLLNDKTGHFVESSDSPVPSGGYSPERVVTGDFNEDGNADIACINEYSSVVIFLGDGSGNLTMKGLPMAIPLAWSLAVGDLDGDSHLDIAVVNSSALNRLFVLRGDGTGLFTTVISDTDLLTPYPTTVKIADVLGDGKLEIIAGSSSDAGGVVHILTNDRVFGFGFDE